MTAATARALANVALVKYFGKRDLERNLPAAGSLSIALEPLATITSVRLDGDLDEDRVRLGGDAAPAAFAGRAARFLDRVRALAGRAERARVDTENSFPTGAGIASSAAGFAALALAATRAYGLELDGAELSALARRGSGSAARSVPGGLAVWHAGRSPDGADSFAERLVAPDEWDLRAVIGVVDGGPKPVGSTEGMERTRATSPYYDAWIATAERDLASARAAVAARDLPRLGEIAEANALAMHAAILAARPGIAYLRGPTLEALHAIRAIRARGRAAWFTCDAGPQPKALVAPEDAEAAAAALAAVGGVRRVIRCRLGGGVALLER